MITSTDCSFGRGRLTLNLPFKHSMRQSLQGWLRFFIVALVPALAQATGLGVAVNDLATTPKNTATQIQVLDNDLDFSGQVTVGSAAPAPQHGSVSYAAGVATYTPAAGFQGNDSFGYSASDSVSTAQATVTVTVLADTDDDGKLDFEDNCKTFANNSGPGAQCDSDNDGFGNRCDADLNNNNFTNAQDTTLFKAQLGQPSVAPAFNPADINCNGFVNSADTTLFKGLLGFSPGPSGLRASNGGFLVGGTAIGGLTGSGLVLRLTYQLGTNPVVNENLTVTGDGPFAFASGPPSSATYSIAVQTQPANPSQTCNVSPSSGTAGAGGLPPIGVNCTTNSYPVGVTVTGRIAGTPLYLENNATGASQPDAATILGNGYFKFNSNLTSGKKYNITVASQPASYNQTCTVLSGGIATVGGTQVTKTIQCATNGHYCYVPEDDYINVFTCDPATSNFTYVDSVPTSSAPTTSVVSDPTGRFVYVTKGGTSPIVETYSINNETGDLLLVGTAPTGTSPETITFDPTATFAWVPNSTTPGTVSVFKVEANGSLTSLGTVPTGDNPKSVTILVTQNQAGVYANTYAYVTTDATTGNVLTYSVASDGTLTPVSGGVTTLPTDPISGAPILAILP